MIEPNKLRPFQKFCVTIGMIPSSYKTSLTYEEQLLWLCNYLEKTIIPAVNNNAEALEEVQTLFTQLKNYIDNYFTSLDVQQEINNKLDQMAQDGTLEQIITSYLNIKAILAFNNVEELKKATNLIEGSFVKTYGFYNYNDGGGSFYKITNENLIENEQNIIKLNNNLFAVLIHNNEVNIKQFGARGNGIENDTINIQACIDYAYANNLQCIFNSGIYNVMQIVLKDNYYFAEKGCKIKQLANISAIVNEKIDMYGTGGKYTGPSMLLTAEKNEDMNKIIIEGNLEIINANEEEKITLTYYEQQQYKGFRWLSAPETIDYFPINFVGLVDSKISGIIITDITDNANINLGLSLRTQLMNCILKNGKDNCLQFFANVQCIGKNNVIENGASGLLVMQGCQKCIFDNNIVSYTNNEITGTNYHMINIKNSKNCEIINNIIEGLGNSSSNGIVLSRQDGDCINILINNNIISNCSIGIFIDYSNSVIITNNNLYKCSAQASRGSITLKSSNNINIENNIINNDNTGYMGISLMSGNNINIISNIIKNISENNSQILFNDGNTETIEYKIFNNKFINDIDNIFNRIVWFPGSSVAKLFKHYLIKNNVKININNGHYYRKNINVDSLIDYDKLINEQIQLRRLNNPIIYSNHFNCTKTSEGFYNLNFLNDIEGLNIIIKSINAQYHAGYNPQDINNNIMKISYDDSSNAQHSIKSFITRLYDIVNNKYSDNPTTNSNASNLLNFGIDLLINYEIDYTNWN